MTAGPALRDATAADAAAVASLHLASWRDAYRGLLPDGFLDGALGGLMAAHWPAVLVRPLPGPVILAVAPGAPPLGFVAAWRQGANMHVDNLHLRPEARGAGIGRVLLGAAASRLLAEGFRTADLWALEGNRGALRFYARLGARLDEVPVVKPAFGHPVPMRRAHWPDLAVLACACGVETSARNGQAAASV